jgi:hypothetical protein
VEKRKTRISLDTVLHFFYIVQALIISIWLYFPSPGSRRCHAPEAISGPRPTHLTAPTQPPLDFHVFGKLKTSPRPAISIWHHHHHQNRGLEVAFSVSARWAELGLYGGWAEVQKWPREHETSYYQGLENIILCYGKCLTNLETMWKKLRTGVQRYPYAFLVSTYLLFT